MINSAESKPQGVMGELIRRTTSKRATMRKDSINDDVMSTREVAEQLGVSLRTVQLWVEGGVLPAWKTAGGHRRVARAAVDRLTAERQQAIRGDAPVVEPFRVLLAEDEPEMRQLVAMVIDGWGLPLQLIQAANGFEALLRIGEGSPDLLITDLSMPGMDGFRMIRSLRSFGRGLENLEVIAITALSAEEVAERGQLPDDVRIFTKPIAFAQLEALVRDRVARHLALDDGGREE
jgi:excisionase family DNA binding protein